MATTQAAPGKKGLINFDFLQKLGKVLMTVIAVMPAAGLMISLGKLVQMGGGDIAAVMTIGTTMENIGWAVINNLHILFAVAIGGSWARFWWDCSIPMRDWCCFWWGSTLALCPPVPPSVLPLHPAG